MKHKKILSFLLCAILLVQGTVPCGAFNGEKHDEYLEEILFGKGSPVVNNVRYKDEITALEYASYLAIDQFNGKGEKELKFLKNSYQVKGISKIVIGEEGGNSSCNIDFKASGTTHRSYTHRGWDFKYIEDKANWEIRKDLLTKTVGTVFNFRGNQKQQDSFSAVIYYIHILGDNCADESYKTKNGLKMDVGGRADNNDIISELRKHLPIVLATAKKQDKNTYLQLDNKLAEYDLALEKLQQSDGGINSELKFKEKIGITKKIIEVLKVNFPILLKDEPFFKNTFYKEEKSLKLWEKFIGLFKKAS